MSELNISNYAREYVDFWRNLHHWQKFYNAAGSDGSDKYHLCLGSIETNARKCIFPKYIAFPLNWSCRTSSPRLVTMQNTLQLPNCKNHGTLVFQAFTIHGKKTCKSGQRSLFYNFLN